MDTDNVKSTVLDILKEHLKAMDSEFQTLTRKAEQTITVSTIVIGFATILNTFSAGQSALGNDQKRFIVAALVDYGAIFMVMLWAALPRNWAAYPIDPTEDNINKVLMLNQEDLQRHIIGSFIGCLRRNRMRLNLMSRLLWIASGLVIFEVILVGAIKLI
jgi:hypothetical protein